MQNIARPNADGENLKKNNTDKGFKKVCVRNAVVRWTTRSHHTAVNVNHISKSIMNDVVEHETSEYTIKREASASLFFI
ncbi:hypothetical protein HXA32_20620 [Salipaludibacillus agaradhaerens]|jgi:hypothetical protein|uniref:hypothetical protein n=1 Tax=Salipaludibacillus agaradhaerens TaxID=76935 RepID=UPI002150DF13|nr:hypothetical protein [Salipaludibacillus agaradhaerens]MCR6108679.1 hypothetical protein [Salipaludibacillus agaradhaerens]